MKLSGLLLVAILLLLAVALLRYAYMESAPAPAEAAAESDWLHNYEEALALAKAEGRPILMNFTGSDWCGGCILLHRQVFSTPEFQKFADERLVLLEVDFPRNKRQSKEVVVQNHKLQMQYGVEGFPTIILAASDGRAGGRLGYKLGGPAVFIPAVEKLIMKLEAGHRE